MARDVAQREVDQAGFRIINLGDPKDRGDATKTDNTSVPKPDAGTGSPGTSLQAAPADHVHPASEGGAASLISLDDLGQQSVTGTTEELVSESLVDFSDLPTPKIGISMAALVKVSAGTARFRLQFGGTPGRPDGQAVLGFSTTSTEFEVGGAGTQGVPNPSRVTLVKIVAATDRTDTTTHIRSKSLQFRGQS